MLLLCLIPETCSDSLLQNRGKSEKSVWIFFSCREDLSCIRGIIKQVTELALPHTYEFMNEMVFFVTLCILSTINTIFMSLKSYTVTHSPTTNSSISIITATCNVLITLFWPTIHCHHSMYHPFTATLFSPGSRPDRKFRTANLTQSIMWLTVSIQGMKIDISPTEIVIPEHRLFIYSLTQMFAHLIQSIATCTPEGRNGIWHLIAHVDQLLTI